MDFRNYTAAQSSRGLRNNNPLNLRPVGFSYEGQIDVDGAGHAIFKDVIYGIRAATLDLYTKYYVHGLKTFDDIIAVFAPYSDGNNEAEYVATLKNLTGIGSGDIGLNGANIERILKAFAFVELGKKYADLIASSDYVKGINSANKEGLKVAVGVGGSFLIVVLVALLFAFSQKNNR